MYNFQWFCQHETSSEYNGKKDQIGMGIHHYPVPLHDLISKLLCQEIAKNRLVFRYVFDKSKHHGFISSFVLNL